jgi:hypothetical protein
MEFVKEKSMFIVFAMMIIGITCLGALSNERMATETIDDNKEYIVANIY